MVCAGDSSEDQAEPPTEVKATAFTKAQEKLLEVGERELARGTGGSGPEQERSPGEPGREGLHPPHPSLKVSLLPSDNGQMNKTHLFFCEKITRIATGIDF